MLIVGGLLLVVALSRALAPRAMAAPVVIPASSGTAEGLLLAGACVMGLAGLGLVIFTLLYLRLLTYMGRSFREQARLARETWAATAATARA